MLQRWKLSVRSHMMSFLCGISGWFGAKLYCQPLCRHQDAISRWHILFTRDMKWCKVQWRLFDDSGEYGIRLLYFKLGPLKVKVRFQSIKMTLSNYVANWLMYQIVFCCRKYVKKKLTNIGKNSDKLQKSESR